MHDQTGREMLGPPTWVPFVSNHGDSVVIDINQKYEYGIWLSFAEIYTEKIYDLLVPPDRHLKRRQLPLKYEFRSGHKYIAGLKQVKVQSIEVWWFGHWDVSLNGFYSNDGNIGSIRLDGTEPKESGCLFNIIESYQQSQPQHLYHQHCTSPHWWWGLCHWGKSATFEGWWIQILIINAYLGPIVCLGIQNVHCWLGRLWTSSEHIQFG